MRGTIIERTPPPAIPGGRGESGGGGWSWLLTVRGIVEAELVRGLLETSGIVPVVLDASDPSPSSWLFLGGDVNALVRIYVPRARLEDARLALLEAGASMPEPHRRPGPAIWARLLWAAAAVLIAGVFAWRLFLVTCTSPC